MSSAADLPDPAASRAVLIGVSRYQKMEPLPAVAGNLRRLKTLLTEPDLWGLSPRHCTVLSNPGSTETVLDAVRAAAAEAEDALLVYFAGHGLVSLKGDLYLALPSSHAERIYSGVSYDLLRSQLVDEATARRRVVILDCCYGGRALDGYMGSGARTAGPTGSAGSIDVADSVAVEGTYVMTAAAGTKQALAPPGEKYTAFTGELLRALEKGVPDGPDPLSMDAIFRHVRRELAAKNRPQPQQRARNGGTSISLVRNRWAVAESRRRAEEERRAAEEEQRAAEEEQRAAEEEQRAAEEEQRAARTDAELRRATEVQARPPQTVAEPANDWEKWARWEWQAAPRSARLQRPGQVLLALSLTVGLLGGGTYLYLRDDTEECASTGVTTVEGECVGVTDGRHVFTKGLDDVSERIRDANDKVLREEAPSVTIALMTSMSASAPEERRRIRHKLEGALLAQQHANSFPEGPKIRLLLANPGHGGTHWARVATQLKDLTGDSSPLRAVIGLDANNVLNQKAISYLAARHIPVVSASTALSPVTGDSAPPGVARVMADLDDQQRALTAWSKLDPQQSVLVSEDNPGDLYVTSLRKEFQKMVKSSPFPAQSYEASDTSEQNNAQEKAIAEIANEVCRKTPEIKTVLFAGRAESLRDFLNSTTGSLSCAKQDLTVISGSDASRLANDPELDWARLRGHGKIRLRYATAFHPDVWKAPSAPPTGGSRKPLETLIRTAKSAYGLSLGNDDLTDGTLVATYDAGLTAFAAIQQSYEMYEPRLPSYVLPGLEDVGQIWPRMKGSFKVEGASGWICLGQFGTPYNKVVPVVELDFVSRQPKFVSAAWPEGKPPSKSCLPPPTSTG
ncbi:caspase domain-containing protein [Streptomyces sp. NPDC015032]|uniref:caspase family protein n=1 Tax=Streptomyces sp. NPDC015032 TaxID=3364937 RepID=UPI00370280C3